MTGVSYMGALVKNGEKYEKNTVTYQKKRITLGPCSSLLFLCRIF